MKQNDLYMWRRICAKITDYAIAFGLLSAALTPLSDPLLHFSLSLAAPILWILPEAILVKWFRKTPGMALFGLKLETPKGQPLSFWSALKSALFLSNNGVLQAKPIRRFRVLAGSLISAFCMMFACYTFSLNDFVINLERQIFTTGWVQYTPSNQKFSVTFPKDPSQESKQLEVPSIGKVFNYEELNSTPTKGITYSVSYVDLPKKWLWAGAGTLLKGGLELLVRTSDEKPQILKKTLVGHQGYAALDFHLKQGEQEIKGRLILVGNTLYKLTVTYPPSKAEQLEDQAFVESFVLN